MVGEGLRCVLLFHQGQDWKELEEVAWFYLDGVSGGGSCGAHLASHGIERWELRLLSGKREPQNEC